MKKIYWNRIYEYFIDFFHLLKRRKDYVTTFKKYGGKDQYHNIKDLFDFYASKLSKVPSIKQYAQFNPQMNRIEYTLYLDNELSVTIAKPIENKDDDNVLYSLAANEKVFLITTGEISKLLDALKEYKENMS